MVDNNLKKEEAGTGCKKAVVSELKLIIKRQILKSRMDCILK